MYRLQQIAEITGSQFRGTADHTIAHYLNDSRALQSPADTLFVAIKSPRNNGHAFIPALVKSGVRSFLVHRDFDRSPFEGPDVSFIVSASPLKALQQLAAHHRSEFKIPVIGITGSNGKTVVKEWLYQLLKQRFTICRSPKSYNSQVGVPLSVLNLNASHNLAIFEAGISQPGEMEQLASVIQPTLGVFTSLGSAHDEGFSDRAQKIAEKLKLFAGCDKIIINGLEKKDVEEPVRSRALFISRDEEADLRLSARDGGFSLRTKRDTYDLALPFSDEASLQNAATCAAVLVETGIEKEAIREGLAKLQSVALRLEIRNGIGNSLIINDYYNSDLDSMRIALNFLQQQNRKAGKIVIVSDIEQSGMPPAVLYGQLAELFGTYQIGQVVGIGREIAAHKGLFPADSLFFSDTNDFTRQFPGISRRFVDAGILLKGARSFGFESISRLLQLKSHNTVFEIDLNKLRDNVNYYRSLLRPGVKMMCMVKAMGYGSGSAEIAQTLQHIGVDYLAVACTDEGVELRDAKVSLPVMVMNPEEDAFEDIIQYRLEPELYSFGILRAFAAKLDLLGLPEPYPVHIKIDTGMHRLGFEEQELEALCSELQKYPQLKVSSVFSHLAGSDNPALDEFTTEQLRIFEKAFSLLEKQLGYPVTKHISNSGGITRFEKAHYDMVRLGIGMYGIGVNKEEQARLRNVGALKTRISQVKELHAGQTVGYNRNGKIERDTRIATIPIGYADGFSRQDFGNGRHGVYVKGSFCRTVGNICMDMSMIDIGGLDCKEGEEVIIFETAEQIHAMAAALNSISYEVLTQVSGRVKRIYIQE